MYRRAIVELLFVIVGALLLYIVSGWFDLAELIVGWGKQYEEFELDEIFSISLFVMIALMIVVLRRHHNLKLVITELKQRHQEITAAKEEIKVLRRILPICSYCKKIQEEDGHWQNIERHIRNHTESRFSHGICPDCMAKHFSEFAASTGTPSG